MRTLRTMTLAGLFLMGCGGDGMNGTAGQNGSNGANGSDGTNGSNGANGSNGSNGANGTNGANGSARDLRFTPVNVALSTTEKASVYASPGADVDGKHVALSYVTELRSGQTLGNNVFGKILQKDGSPVLAADSSPFISNANDFSSLLQVGNKIFEITHFETTPAAMYLTELAQDAAGKLTAVSTRNIDFAAHEGLWTPCAGSVSPWNTHLGSEEYPADARIYEGATQVSQLSSAEKAMLRYWNLDPATATIAQAKAVYNPYRYGNVVEIAVDAAGNTTVKKHPAAGRRALELAYVMPDGKTVYLSDDGANDAFYMFIAKNAGDLSEGQLYAARWFQTSPAGGAHGSADLYWIPLGPSATDAQVKALVDGGIKFSDIFDTEAQDATGACPSAANGYVAINADTGRECLHLKANQELAASRLESRRYAAYLGATTEFRKTEGITFDPDSNRLFISFSELNQGMTNDPTAKDLGGPNHIKVQRNDCGGVYQLVVTPNVAIGSDFVAESASSLIEGTWLKDAAYSLYPQTSPYYDPTAKIAGSTVITNVCSVSGIANPDNLTFLRGYDTLLIGEDTTDGHQNDVVWAFNLTSHELTRIFSTPYGAETTGVYFYPNVNGHAYIKTQVQHPYGESDEDKAPDANARQSYVGYIGPLPAMN